MGIFYLVNHHDPDMRLYSWEVVSCTVSIFVAILVFHGLLGFSDLVVHDLEEAYHLDPGLAHTAVHTAQAVLIFLAMHCVMYTYSSKAVAGSTSSSAAGTLELHPRHKVHHSDEVVVAGDHMEHIPNDRKQDLVCWAILMAHMASFAAIHAGGAAQHWVLETMELDRFKGPVLSMFALVPVVAIFFVLFRASDLIRSTMFEGELQLLEVWDEIAEEAENEIASLALSFLAVQAVRYLISGYLPGPEGSEHDHLDHGLLCVLLLLGASGLFVGLRVFLVMNSPSQAEEREASLEIGLEEYFDRWAYIGCSAIAMCFAWCLLYATMWSVSRQLVQSGLADVGFGPNSAAVRATVAVLMSIIVFGFMLALDKFSDAMAGSAAEKALRGIIRSLGVLVGFSWEQAFAGGVEAIVEATMEQQTSHWYPPLIRAGIALLLGVGVVPAWKMYILKTLLDLREVYKQNRAGNGADGEAENGDLNKLTHNVEHDQLGASYYSQLPAQGAILAPPADEERMGVAKPLHATPVSAASTASSSGSAGPRSILSPNLNNMIRSSARQD